MNPLAAEQCATLGRGMADHFGWDPNLYLWVLERGTLYSTSSATPQGRPRMCFKNAADLVIGGQVANGRHRCWTYVEGFAVGPNLGSICQHAWAVDPDGNVHEATWEVPSVSYFGVPFSVAEWREAVTISNQWDILSTVSGLPPCGP